MNIEQQVTSLELSKRLKELNVKQESLFYWQNEPYNDGEDDICIKIKDNVKNLINVDDINNEHPIYSAFTASELGEMLPKYIENNRFDCEVYYTQIPSKHCNNWIILYRNSFFTSQVEEQEDVNEVNCRAKMLIHLLENGMIHDV